MRPLTIIATLLTVFISNTTNSAGSSRTELERAIASLVARSGPSAAYSDESSILLPPGLVQHSLWQRLHTRFEFTDIEHPDINKQIEYFRRGLYSLRSNLSNAQPFLYFIADELDRAGLPLDLTLLPLVESAYNPHAQSERNAVGIWQFIPSTADIFGLPFNENYDGRKDIVQSTEAAIKYLKKLHDTFDGDWLLAMAAYNTGPSNVRAAMAKAVEQGVEPNFWNLRLAAETKNYVPRILAAVRLIAFAADYGLELPEVKNKKAIDIVSVGRPLSFSQIARITDHSIDKIASLNPGHTHLAIPTGGPYHVAVPTQNSDRLVAAIKEDKLGAFEPNNPVDGVPIAIPGTENKFSVIPDAYLPEASESLGFKPYRRYVYQSHVVSKGENLWRIAKSMGTDLATLQDWNGHSDKPLQPGDALIAAYLQTETAEDEQLRTLNYRVHSSDTLVSISDKFDVKISDLKKWNPALWSKNNIQAGQLIKIPVATSAR